MKRENAKRLLMKELKKVPDMETCRWAKEEKVRKEVTQRSNFSKIRKFVEKKDLNLKTQDIPRGFLFQAVLYTIFLREEVPSIGDLEIWDEKDEPTMYFIESHLRRLGLDEETDHLCEVPLSNFLKYVKKEGWTLE